MTELWEELSATCEPMEPSTPTPRLCRLGDLLGEWQADAEAAHAALQTGQPRGPITGLPALDRELGGALWPGMHILHGQPGAGKTAFVLQVAACCGCPCLYVTCEMAPLELLRRIAARVTTTFLGKFKTGELLPADSLEKARAAAQAAPHLTLADATQVYAAPRWIATQARLCKGEARHLLVIVDSLHSWADAEPTPGTEYDKLNWALAELKKLAAMLEGPVLAVAERNRASMGQGGLSAGAGTRKIEYGAETVLDLGRDEKVNPDAGGEVPVSVKLAKNRHGAPGRIIELTFHGALQRFKEELG